MKITITDLSEKLKQEIFIAAGVAAMVAALEACPHKTMPGFALAKAIVDVESAKQRGVESTAIYKEIARHGHNLSKIKTITTTAGKGNVALEIEFFDLADEGEGL